jgi:site-specific DNA-methyltransferase (adenine-specific)
MINLNNCDNMEFMKGLPDNHYDLAICDPPYGIEDKISIGGGSHTKTKTKFHNLYSKNGKKWDVRPSKEYFTEVQRVSKNQVFFGGNYFAENLPVSRGWAVWDKQGQGMSSVNDELIWTSFDISIKTFSRCHGLDKGFMNKEGKNIHPTQKPIQLYKWLLKNYATCPSCENKGWIWLTQGKQTDCPKCKGYKPKILDTHGGSMSIALACYDMGFDLDLCELDKDYYEAGVKRFEQHKKQLKLAL